MRGERGSAVGGREEKLVSGTGRNRQAEGVKSGKGGERYSGLV